MLPHRRLALSDAEWNHGAMVPASTPALDPATLPDPGEAYLRAVTQLGEQRAVVTTAPIFSANGLKLVEAGIRIDRRLYDRLVQHRLNSPIDEQLAVEGALDTRGLIAAARTLIDERPFCTRLSDAAGGVDTLLHPLTQIPLPAPIAFKLTLMRETQPQLFIHSLQMMLVALLLGIKTGRRARGLSELAAAALLHDLGVLHIDPEMLRPGHRMSPEERRHLFAHPVTTSMILKGHPEFSPEIVRAVLEHHERLDGTGYPRGLTTDQLSADGKILMLAEVVSAMFEKNWDAPGLRLSLILRLNHRKFERDHVNALADLLRDENRALAQTAPPQQEIDRIAALGQLLENWKALTGAACKPPAHPSEGFVSERLREIERTLHEAGLDPALLAFLLEEPDRDPETLSELALLAREAQWLIDALIQDVLRRWPDLDEQAAPITAAFLRQAAEPPPAAVGR